MLEILSQNVHRRCCVTLCFPEGVNKVSKFLEVARYTFTLAVRSRPPLLASQSANPLDHLIATWRSDGVLDQTCSPPQWLEAQVCEEPLRDAPKIAINKNSY